MDNKTPYFNENQKAKKLTQKRDSDLVIKNMFVIVPHLCISSLFIK